MEELFEELKHHKLERVLFTAERFEVTLLGGLKITTDGSYDLFRALKVIRTASNHDARADDSEGGCRE